MPTASGLPRRRSSRRVSSIAVGAPGEDGDAGAVVGERLGDRPAHALAAAGDDGGASFRPRSILPCSLVPVEDRRARARVERMQKSMKVFQSFTMIVASGARNARRGTSRLLPPRRLLRVARVGSAPIRACIGRPTACGWCKRCRRDPRDPAGTRLASVRAMARSSTTRFTRWGPTTTPGRSSISTLRCTRTIASSSTASSLRARSRRWRRPSVAS